MDANSNNSKRILEAAIDAMRTSEPDRIEMERHAARVWARIGHELSAQTNVKAAAGQLRSCEDYRSLIPDYIAGRLSAARKLLFTDHTHECVACRNALDAARDVSRQMPVERTRPRFNRKLAL